MIKRILLVAGLCSIAGVVQCGDISFSHGKFITGSFLSTTVMTVAWAMKAQSSIDPMYRAAITASVLTCTLVNSFVTRGESASGGKPHMPSFIGGFLASPLLLWFSKYAISL